MALTVESKKQLRDRVRALRSSLVKDLQQQIRSLITSQVVPGDPAQASVSCVLGAFERTLP